MDETLKEDNPSPARETTKEESSSFAIKNEKLEAAAHNKTKEPPEVSVVRNWKEYLGECALIVFSVLLALVLTEYFNGLHEKSDKHCIETASQGERTMALRAVSPSLCASP